MTDKVQKIREEVARIQLYTQSEVLKQVLDYIDEVQKEPVSEELWEAAQIYYEELQKEKFEGSDVIDAFKAGAQWQKEQFEKDYTDLCNGIATAKGVAVAMAYDKGMADAKEQMMANAIDGKVIANGMGNPILHLWDKGRHLINKKVKVIVIKED